jgi:peptidoglycan/xylan/chitin deacetylase (PgdA/CDA1 family)
MRILAIVSLCLLSGISAAAAQSDLPQVVYPVPLANAEPETPAVTPAVAQPSAPIEQAVPAEQAVKPADTPTSRKLADACPGNPNALGTSRVLTITPTEFSRIGTIQYKGTLPLNDHEVVLTFDDGPIPPYSNIILDTLEAQCVKATYFMVGEMAHAYPAIARRIYNAGMTVGTHSQHHPYGFERLGMQRVEREVDGGIASVDDALGDARAVSPFFRIPGLGRTKAIESFLQDRGLVTWSADIDTNDWWRGTSPGAVVQRAMHRLNARGRGIILMHDIHPATALALPTLLKELKANGYHVVQVVAAGERPKEIPELVATPAEDKGNWPRVLHTASIKSDRASISLRHRVKRLIAGKHHVKTASLPNPDLSAAARAWQSGQY